jgi:hypothetical protein
MMKKLRHCGRPNRRARKIVNLRISQWKRSHGIPAHESLQPMDWLKAAYGGAFRGKLRWSSPLARPLVKGAFG